MRCKSNLKGKVIISLCLLTFITTPIGVVAQRGCCSRHGGVAGCNEDGRQVCNDGTLSPSCTCTPKVKKVYGCTDPDAKNYNSKANKDNGSCKYYVYGCMDETAKNFNSNAEKDDGSCEYYIYGCTDKLAKNYNSSADKDDGSCDYYKYGCKEKNASNYDPLAEKDDGSCRFDNVEEDETKEVEEEASTLDTILGMLTLTVIGTGIYYTKKKKKNK